MSNPYVSSIVSKYGDTNNVKRDTKVLHEILGRQGTSLLIDVIAESVGNTVNQFSLSTDETRRLVGTLVKELNEALNERT